MLLQLLRTAALLNKAVQFVLLRSHRARQVLIDLTLAINLGDVLSLIRISELLFGRLVGGLLGVELVVQLLAQGVLGWGVD